MSGGATKIKLDNRARVIESVKSGLASVGVQTPVILHILASKHGIKPEQIPERPELFASALVSIFGEGSKQVILAILRELLVCSYEGVEFSPLVVALTEALGGQANVISLGKIAEERELTERRERASIGPVRAVRGPQDKRDRDPDAAKGNLS